MDDKSTSRSRRDLGSNNTQYHNIISQYNGINPFSTRIYHGNIKIQFTDTAHVEIWLACPAVARALIVADPGQHMPKAKLSGKDPGLV